MYMKKHKESGFVLVQAIVWMIVFSIMSMSLFQLASHSLSSGNKWRENRETLLLAESALEKTKRDIYTIFREYYTTNANGIEPQDKRKMNWFNTISDTKMGAGSLTYTIPVDETLDTEGSAHSEVEWLSKGTYTIKLETKSVNTYTKHLKIKVYATYNNSTRIVEEVVEYKLDSNLFQYAYFVNNFGWMYGSNINIYGDCRANADFALKYTPKIHGDVYAAENMKKGSKGEIGGKWKHDSIDQYLKSAPDFARHTSTEESPIAEGYDGTINHFPQQAQEPMPYLGNLTGYMEEGKAMGSTIIQDGNTLVTGYYDGPGPDGVEGTGDDGSIVLDGRVNPIEITGTIVVTGDVVILGKVTGQGAIYSGRNTHIMGDIVSQNPPTFDQDAKDPEQDILDNADKDLVALISKGNIIMGNPNDSTWLKQVSKYIDPGFTDPYETHATDASIGYDSDNNPSNGFEFDGNYLNYDGGMKVTGDPVITGGNAAETGSFETWYNSKKDTSFATPPSGTADQFSVGDEIVIDGKTYGITDISNTKFTLDQQAPGTWKNKATGAGTWGGGEATITVPQEKSKYYESVVNTELINALDTGKVAQVDALVYTNHVITGYVGQIKFHGGIYSRDEAIIFQGNIDMTWDIRLAKGMAEKIGMDDFLLPKTLVPPKTVYWREVKK